jgi:RNA polymerase sigma-70 factor (ECF subfamily)
VIRAREDRWFDRFCRTGDPRLLAKVFERTAPELWKVAIYLCRDRHVAEDAVQGAFLAAIEAQHDWDAARPLLPWLLGLLANRVREHRRRAARAPVAERLPPAAGERDPAELAEWGEFGSAFRAALARVAEPYRAVVERHLVHGHAAHEIAAEIGVPAGTVRMRLHRGLDQLRQKLPTGFVAGGLAVAALSPESFAAMRQVVLARVPGGAAVAAVGSGHFVLVGVLGGILMKKVMAVVAAGLVLGLGLWSLWPEVGGAAQVVPGAPAIVAVTVRPLPAATNDVQPAVSAGTERVAAGPSARAPRVGRLRVVLRHGGTGEPVSLNLQVHAGLSPDGTPRAPTPGDIQFGTTDAQGIAVFTLPIGRAKVSSSTLLRDAPFEVEVVAGAETELAVELPVQLTAEVEVVDSQGRPIADARILGRTRVDVGYFVERELGRTGPDGHWRQQFLEAGVPVRATCDGFIASAPVDLHGRQPRRQLVLEDGPALVAGTVFDAGGQPVPGARIMIQPLVAGVAGERPMALVADAQGRYESAHVRPGAIAVFASRQVAGGQFQTARADAQVKGLERHELDVRFTGGARLVVRLTSADGRPVVGQEVNAVWWPEREVYGHLSEMSRACGETDAAGVCAFDGLLPGDYEVQGYAATWRRAQKVTLFAGSEQRCEWSLASPVDIEVQVVDEAREPLEGWRVALLPQEGSVRSADTDQDGLVRFEQVADEAYEVAVQQRAGVVHSARAKVANGQRTVVVVSKASMPTASIHGTARLPDGMVPADVRAELRVFDAPNGGSLRRELQESDATFHFPDLPAGVYELAFRRESDREYLTMPQRIEVPPAATVEVGNIALSEPADVRVDAACVDGGKVRSLLIGVALGEKPRCFGAPRFVSDANGATLQAMPSGRFELLVWGADIAPLFVPLVVAGKPVQLSVAPERAVPTTFRFVGLSSGQGGTTMVFRQQGVELLSELLREAGEPVRGFLPGSYRVEVETRGGQRGAADFIVGTSPGPVVEVQLAR